MNRWSPTTARILLLVIICLMPVPSVAAGPVASGTGTAEPIVVLDEPGVEIAITGSATMQLDPAAGTHLTLERISIAEGATFGPLTPATPELVVLSDGALVQQDERGFWSRMEAPFQMALPAGEAFAWTADSESTLLRLRLTDATPDSSTFDGVGIERVAQFRLEAVPAEPVLVFIAEASLSGGGDGTRLAHDGTVGIVVESGAIDVLSPSGLPGTLGEGQAALYPNGAPIEVVGTADNAPASAVLVGVSTTARTLEAGG